MGGGRSPRVEEQEARPTRSRRRSAVPSAAPGEHRAGGVEPMDAFAKPRRPVGGDSATTRIALTRSRLGKLCGPRYVSCVAVLNTDGLEDQLKDMLREGQVARKKYEDEKAVEEKESEEDRIDSNSFEYS